MNQQRTHFAQQFIAPTPRKQARRERFLRKVAGRRHHLSSHLRRARRLASAGKYL